MKRDAGRDLRPSEEKIGKILETLDALYPDARCTLDHNGPFELLVATILSAQCTDERVNQVTPGLFKKYSGPQAFAEADLGELEEDIRSTGFFRNKAKNIKACAEILHETYQGNIPADLDVLVELPGIGRKTANVVLGNAFGIPGMVVDTHVGRVSMRLGLTAEKDAVKAEKDLMEIIPRERWVKFSHQIIQHGRRVCSAKKPKCSECSFPSVCIYYKEMSRNV